MWAALDDVERTAQRGAWQASLERTLMKLKRATPILGIPAVVLLAIVTYQLFGGSRLGRPAEPSPTPRLIVAADLSTIVPPNHVDINTGSPYPAVTGYPALSVLLPDGAAGFPETGFVEARLTEYHLEGGAETLAVLFKTAAEARRAFAFLATALDVKSTHGWRLERSSENSGLGDESVWYTGSAPVYDLRHVGVSLWRVNNVVLAAFIWNYEPARLRAIAEGMDARAH